MHLIDIEDKDRFMKELTSLFEAIVKDKTVADDAKHTGLAGAASVAMGIASKWAVEIHRKFAYYTLMIQEIDRGLN